MNASRTPSQDPASTTPNETAAFGHAVLQHCTRLRAVRRMDRLRHWRRLLAWFADLRGFRFAPRTRNGSHQPTPRPAGRTAAAP